MPDALSILTEKEKQTLRLMGRGHDAKSMARQLGLSVHTINERLRAARRKLAVSSSREAARLLLASEGAHPESSVDKELGEAGRPDAAADRVATIGRPARCPSRLIAGVFVMSLIVAIAALLMHAQPSMPPATSVPTAPGQASPARSDIARTARDFLILVDASRWADSYRATGRQFQAVNSLEAWTRASESARVPLGAVRSRELVSTDDVPAPPNGYQMVRFRSSFVNRAQAVETVTLEREGPAWKVVAVMIE